MGRLSPYRLRRARKRWFHALLLVVFVTSLLDLLEILHAIHPTPPLRTTEYKRNQRIFIASMHWNNEQILLSHWNKAMIGLVHKLGAENVYVSILESGSWDDTKGALKELDKELGKLGVARNIELDTTSHKDEISRTPAAHEEGWITPSSTNQLSLRRIPYLAQLRNRVMKQLAILANQEKSPRTFDKVLWLNDVVYTAEDVITLLETNKGVYAAACSLDFSKPPIYYDTFALRDSSGAKPIMQTWPFFGSSASRSAIKTGKPVLVQSCWNGITVFDAEPFYAKPALSFRGISDSLAESHLEGSECCLIHADNPLTKKKGVWLNPNVRVGYNGDAYEAVNPSNGIWPSYGQRLQGLWTNRFIRILRKFKTFTEDWTAKSRVNAWMAKGKKDGTPRNEPGLFCLINEMQILIENGWKHV